MRILDTRLARIRRRAPRLKSGDFSYARIPLQRRVEAGRIVAEYARNSAFRCSPGADPPWRTGDFSYDAMPCGSMEWRTGMTMVQPWQFIVLVLLAFVAAAQAQDARPGPGRYFVAVDGHDGWSGTLPAANADKTDGPFATLERARDEIRKLKAAGALRGPTTVHVRGGMYEMASTFTLGPEDSGAADSPVVYRAYPNEKPVLVGARKVTGFQPYKGGILQCNVKGTALEGVVFRQLFFRGERMTMARYPNVDPKDPHGGAWAHVAATEGKEIKDRLVCTDDVIKGWTKVQYADVCIHPSYGWGWSICPIKSVSREEKKISLARSTSYAIQVGDRYFVRNLLEELDAPGEWYLDRDAGVLYFWPPGDVAQGEARAPVVKTLVELNGASYMTVRGFTLEACDGDAARIVNCESSQVAQCVIRNCGGWGVVVQGGHKSGAMGNDIYATGAGGVNLSGGDRKTLERGDNFATNNYIHHIAEFQKTYHTGVNVTGVGNTASHNLIHDCYHQGILMGGNENTVEFNIVHHTNLGSEDTGGLYMSSRDWSQRGNIIRQNIFHHVGGFGKTNAWQPIKDGKVEF
ncbi:MAG: right-handed parallel beta-helix repeat-containing protein, partial [Planctomycetes bacterium]|nr:right-handed parallel beta-helix repeat-containing protein [Planctomycetota bacterium]